MDMRYSKNHILILQDICAYAKLSSLLCTPETAYAEATELKSSYKFKSSGFVGFFVVVIVVSFVSMFVVFQSY